MSIFSCRKPFSSQGFFATRLLRVLVVFVDLYKARLLVSPQDRVEYFVSTLKLKPSSSRH